MSGTLGTRSRAIRGGTCSEARNSRNPPYRPRARSAEAKKSLCDVPPRIAQERVPSACNADHTPIRGRPRIAQERVPTACNADHTLSACRPRIARERVPTACNSGSLPIPRATPRIPRKRVPFRIPSLLHRRNLVAAHTGERRLRFQFRFAAGSFDRTDS